MICDSEKEQSIIICDEEFEPELEGADHSKNQNGSLKKGYNERYNKINIKEDEIESDTLSCNICYKVFDSKIQLSSHNKSVHNANGYKKFECKECGARCRSKTALSIHSRKHKGRHFECYLCGREYAARTKLLSHIKNTHQNSHVKNYLCPICGMGYKDTDTLQYHIKLHNNKSGYTCIFCSFTTLTPNGLKRHERTHTGERPYKCQYCKKTFADITERIKHEKSHNDILKYECQYCDRKFVKLSQLKLHKLSHPGDFTCHICSKTFPEAPILRIHFQLAHNLTK